MLDKYSDVFEDKLGTFTSAKAKLTLREDKLVYQLCVDEGKTSRKFSCCCGNDQVD